MTDLLKHPASDSRFLEVRFRDVAIDPTLRGLCVGYEGGAWREEAFAKHVIEWLPEFALDFSERKAIGDHNCVKVVAKAAQSVYTSDKYKSRGEFGEVFLHMALRQDCGSFPAISKVYFKSAGNETVKGFDAVHVVGPPGDLELWLGEVKFYEDINDAIREVVAELKAHTANDYLRSEFIWIGNKLDSAAPHAAELQRLLDRNQSLDTIFKRLCFPILLTYDSPCVAAHNACSAAYEAAFRAEVCHHYAALVAKGLPANIRIHVMLLPLRTKKSLVAELDRRLKLCQQL
jgi:hypothetical protein